MLQQSPGGVLPGRFALPGADPMESPAGMLGCQRGHGVPHEIFLTCLPVPRSVAVSVLGEALPECTSLCQINSKGLCPVVESSLLVSLSPSCPLLAHKGSATYPSSQSCVCCGQRPMVHTLSSQLVCRLEEGSQLRLLRAR